MRKQSLAISRYAPAAHTSPGAGASDLPEAREASTLPAIRSEHATDRRVRLADQTRRAPMESCTPPDSTQVPGGRSVRRQCYLIDGARVPGPTYTKRAGCARLPPLSGTDISQDVGLRVPFSGNRVTGVADPPFPPPADHPEDQCYPTHT